MADHVLKDVTVDIPEGVLTVVTGVAGSGKSSLINDVFLAQHPDAIVIDQSAVGVSRRSNPATYTGLMDGIRTAFAKANKVSPSLFSFNSKDACPNCQGLGVIYTDLAFLEGIKSPCEVCAGKRFSEEVLGHTLRGRSISDVLELTAEEALEFFTERKLRPVLQAINDVIEHNLDFIKNADWIIDLGPDGGSQGGQVVFEGTPRELLGAPGSFTAEILRKDVASVG